MYTGMIKYRNHRSVVKHPVCGHRSSTRWSLYGKKSNSYLEVLNLEGMVASVPTPMSTKTHACMFIKELGIATNRRLQLT